jgi:hypothetical protein
VVCLSAPSGVKKGMLYVGNEDGQIVDNEWLRNDQRAYLKSIPDYLEVIQPHKRDTLLNCGIIGGDAKTYRSFLGKFWEVAETAAKGVTDATDMPIGNYVFFKHFNGKIVSGAPINTRFKHFEKVNGVWFQHK